MIYDVYVENFLAIIAGVVAVLIKADTVTGITNQIILTLFMLSEFFGQAFLDLFYLNL